MDDRKRKMRGDEGHDREGRDSDLAGAEASDSARTMFPWKRASPSTKKKKVSHDVKIKSVNSDGTEVR